MGDGVGIVPVAVGLFGLAEILSTPSHTVADKVATPRLRELMPSREEWRQSAAPIARGSVLGFLVGIVPGSAHIIASFLSYAVERRISKQPEEFGKGAVAGVAGPESANNAASTGAFVPMLALGLPTGPVTAVMMAALLIKGIAPGPQLVTERPEVFWGFVASMYVGNVVLLALNLPLVGLFVSVLRIPYAYLYPLIVVFCILGVYLVNNSVVDVWIMLVMGASATPCASSTSTRPPWCSVSSSPPPSSSACASRSSCRTATGPSSSPPSAPSPPPCSPSPPRCWRWWPCRGCRAGTGARECRKSRRAD